MPSSVCVVGTHLEENGATWSPVDGARVTRFMNHVRGPR